VNGYWSLKGGILDSLSTGHLNYNKLVLAQQLVLHRAVKVLPVVLFVSNTRTSLVGGR
jgi:hypothetical protein